MEHTKGSKEMLGPQLWVQHDGPVYRSKLCSREFPAETLSLQRQVEQFSRSEGQRDRITVVTAVTRSLAGPTERAAPRHSYGG
ncbi:hypothetical protein CRENBAI_021441 [Crenichthys baileyi]|uniref:Uncharacterized protein n=1 Tax=Crenichthys baileyi TaxID=28760 RepID=A0AAV9RQ69_9TELE